LTNNGVRIFGPNATASPDFEPEYIAVSNDGKHAVVGLQANKAFAKVDLMLVLKMMQLFGLAMMDIVKKYAWKT